jgi:hypothetical protein
MEKEESKSDKIHVKDLCLIIKHQGSWGKFQKEIEQYNRLTQLKAMGNLNLKNSSLRDSFYQAEADELIGKKLAAAREIKRFNKFFQKWCDEDIFEEVGDDEYRLRFFAATGPSSEKPIFFFSSDDPEYSEYFKNLAIRRGATADIIRNLDLHLTRTERLEISEKELDRIKKIYVPPLNYERARKILKDKKFLIIIGPPHTGKTTTAIHLLLELKEELAIDKILKCSTYEDFETIDDSSSNILILLDDPFGGSMYERGDIVNIITEELMPVSEKKYILLTSRKQVFDVAKRKTKLGERYINDNLIELKQEGSYSDKNLKEILKKHMLYAKEKLSAEQIQLVELNENIIISELRFPHNIERFVDVHLKDAHNEESLHLQ